MTSESEEPSLLLVEWVLRAPAFGLEFELNEVRIAFRGDHPPDEPVRIVQEVDWPAFDEDHQATDDELDRLVSGFAREVRAWAELNQVVLVDDPAAVLEAYLSEPEVSDAQRANFDVFVADDRCEDAVDGCLAVIEAANLPLDDVGDKWGVTVLPSSEVLLRLNVGTRALLDVLADGAAHVRILESPDEFTDLPPDSEITQGFSQVPGSHVIRLPLESVEALVERPDVAAAVAAHAQATWRTLPGSNAHNPLTESLLFEEA